jgi:hypothetical protein
MAKNSGHPFVKKNFPGMKRITTEHGGRVLLFEGKEFETKQDIYLYKNPPKSGIDGEVEKAQNLVEDQSRRLNKMRTPR